MPSPEEQRAMINARLNGCEHGVVLRVAYGGGWICQVCDQAFTPLLDEPVRPRADATRRRLSPLQEW